MDLFVELFRQNQLAELSFAIVAPSLLLIRILAFFHFAPVFSHKSVPAHARIVLAFILTTMLAEKVQLMPVPEEGFSIVYAVLINFVLGFIMGFTANLLFTTVIAGGEMMDASMGFSAGQTFDPSLGGQTTIIGKFMGMLSVVVFFSIGGPEMLLTGISGSIETFDIYNPAMTINIFRIIHMSGDIIRQGFLLVSPIVLTILINDLVLGLLSRASPQINAFQISFTIKPSIGSLVWLMIMPLFFAGVSNLFLTVYKLF